MTNHSPYVGIYLSFLLFHNFVVERELGFDCPVPDHCLLLTRHYFPVVSAHLQVFHQSFENEAFVTKRKFLMP